METTGMKISLALFVMWTSLFILMACIVDDKDCKHRTKNSCYKENDKICEKRHQHKIEQSGFFVWRYDSDHICPIGEKCENRKECKYVTHSELSNSCELQVNHCKNCDTDMFRRTIKIKEKDEIVYDCKCELTNEELLTRRVKILEEQVKK